jgi:succinyl-CoA synthetase alpha subunit
VADTAQAVVKALAELGPILGPILAGVSTAIGLAQIAIIQDQISTARSLRRGGVLRAQGGMIIGPSHENGGVRLAQAGIIAEGNESIINRQSTLDYQSLLSSINVAGGGRPLVYNNFDDSRIVEALAKQQQKPIRAYVLGSEITNEQAISKRLDDLSKI